MVFQHTPVLLSEVLSFLPAPTNCAIDFTLGGGNHSYAMLTQKPETFLYGVDRDPEAIAASSTRLAEFSNRIKLVHASFAAAAIRFKEDGIKADFILADLGVSSHQIDSQSRGFSLRVNGPLDMRMDPTQAETAADIVNSYTEEELTRIIRDYGEERFANRISKNIVKYRQIKPFTTTLELTECIIKSIPMKFQFGNIHAATKTFQAIRIQVNKEIEELQTFLENSLDLLNSGGRLAIISFHSLEDRPVKQQFKKWEAPCTCPKEFPVCICNLKPMVKPISRKVITADEKEKERNLRSRSAKLRVVEKL